MGVVSMSEVSSWDIIREIASTPPGAIALFIQFLLGLALGYIVAKIFKYILALIAILILGSLLSMWSIGSLPRDTLERIGLSIETLKTIASLLLAILIGPIATGFIIGIVIGLIRK